MRVLHLVAVSAVFSLATVQFEFSKRGDFEASGIEPGDEGFGSDSVFRDVEPEVFLEAFQGTEKNETLPQLQDRSSDLYERQQCQAGYGYCSGKLLLIITHKKSPCTNSNISVREMLSQQ